MLRNRSVLSLNNTFSPSNDYLHIPFHEQSGETFAIEGRLNGVDFTDTGTLAGSPTSPDIWTDNPGYVRVEGDNYCELNELSGADYEALLAPGNHSSMLILLALDVEMTTPGDGADHWLFAYGYPNAAAGYGIYVDNQNPVRLKVAYREDGAVSPRTKQFNSNLSTGANYVWLYLDFVNRTNCMVGIDGNIENGETFDINGEKADDITALPANKAITVFAARQDASTLLGYCNINGNLTNDVHDLWAIPFDSVLTDAQISEHITRFSQQPYEKLNTI